MRVASKKPKRAYRMTARAASSERTTQGIFEAATALFRELPYADVTVQAVADRAGVSLQTVLRKFGSKDGLFEAAAAAMAPRFMAERAPDRPGDVRSALEALTASYEAMGQIGWRALCQEEQFDFVHAVLARARDDHRAWVERTFAEMLPRGEGARERRILLLFAATDFYVWKLFRHDLAIGREATLERMIDLVTAVGDKR
jgi:AcrR family transcriptional regulator